MDGGWWSKQATVCVHIGVCVEGTVLVVVGGKGEAKGGGCGLCSLQRSGCAPAARVGCVHSGLVAATYCGYWVWDGRGGTWGTFLHL